MQHTYSMAGDDRAFAVCYWTTVIVAEFEVTPPLVAVTVEVPTVEAVASPVEEIEATELGRAFQVEMAVTSPVLPSLKVAVAVN